MFKKLWANVKARAVAAYWWLKAEHYPLWVAAHVFVGAVIVLSILSLASCVVVFRKY